MRPTSPGKKVFWVCTLMLILDYEIQCTGGFTEIGDGIESSSLEFSLLYELSLDFTWTEKKRIGGCIY